jgi:hypothetical protein
VVDQIKDATSRLIKKNEEVNELKQQCIVLGVYRSPSPSSGSDHIEMSPESGMNSVLDERSSSRSPPRCVHGQEKVSAQNFVRIDAPNSSMDPMKFLDGEFIYEELPDTIQVKRSILIQRCSGPVRIETRSNNYQILIQDHEGPIHIGEGPKLSDYNPDAGGVEEYTNAEDRRIPEAIKTTTSNKSSTIQSLRSETLADIDVSNVDGRSNNALQTAAFNGNIKIVRMLLKHGANVNARGGKFGNTLQAASWKGHVEVVRLLLESGADVNMQGGEYGNALQAASYRGHVEVVKLLLECGADVNMQGGKLGNALQAASCNSSEEVVKLLLESGADVEDAFKVVYEDVDG